MTYSSEQAVASLGPVWSEVDALTINLPRGSMPEEGFIGSFALHFAAESLGAHCSAC
jgi:hypothetical protein